MTTNNEFYNQRSSDALSPRKQSTTGKFLAMFGTLLLLSVPVSLVVTIFKIYNGFQEITLYGTGDSKAMAGMISESLVPLVLGFVIALTGAIIVCISITFFKYYTGWLFYVSIAAAVLSLLMFPVGTLISIVIIIMLVKRKGRFFEAQENI